MKRMVALCLFLTVFALVGCETTKGLGKDMQKAGKWVEDTVEKVKK